MSTISQECVLQFLCYKQIWSVSRQELLAKLTIFCASKTFHAFYNHHQIQISGIDLIIQNTKNCYLLFIRTINKILVDAGNQHALTLQNSKIAKQKMLINRINLILIFILFPNNMKTQAEDSPGLNYLNKQTLQAKHTFAKSFLRKPSDSLQRGSTPIKSRGTSIGKYWDEKAYGPARYNKMTYSDLFNQANSAKEIHSSNGKTFQGSNNCKFFKRMETKNAEEQKKINHGQIPILNFSKTPKSHKIQKIGHEMIQFSDGKGIKPKNMEQTSQGRSTQNSDKINYAVQRNIIPEIQASTFSNFQITPKTCLQQLINKNTFQIDAQQDQSKQFPYARRGSLNSEYKQDSYSLLPKGEGLPTHAITREIGGGSFSNSYPTNNPFLKFKPSESTILKKSKVFSNKLLQNFDADLIIQKQFKSLKHITKVYKKPTSKQDFQMGKRLGKGKYGDVFLAKHIQLGFICAMKIIQKQLVRRQTVQNQICRQMKISHFIAHPNVTTMYGYFDDQKNIYLIMELCSGGNLFQVLKQKKRIPEKQAVSAIKQLCQGVEYLHSENIIHRDIKPQNIIIQNGQLKICDFGWAVFCQDKFRSTFCGTPLYVSPQVLKGDDYDQKIDIWAIGILTYEILVGKVPFRINSEADMAKIIYQQVVFPEYVQISDFAKDFILSILNRDPKNRMDIEQMLNHDFLKQDCPKHFLLE